MNSSTFSPAPVAPATPAVPPLHVALPYQRLSPTRLTQAMHPPPVRLPPLPLTSPWKELLLWLPVWKSLKTSQRLKELQTLLPWTSAKLILPELRNPLSVTHRFPHRLLLLPLSLGGLPRSLHPLLDQRGTFLLEPRLLPSNSWILNLVPL